MKNEEMFLKEPYMLHLQSGVECLNLISNKSYTYCQFYGE